MIFDPVVEQLVASQKVEVPPSQVVIPALPGPGRPAPSVDQVQRTDGTFSEMRESDFVAGLLGMQFGILLLHDILLDTFTVEEEEEVKPKLKPDPEDAKKK
jgi:hypothetical protein